MKSGNKVTTLAKSNSVQAAVHHHIGIIGSGFGGIALSKHLQDAGIENFVIFERANEVGGTWRDNNYPGCACDVASNLYSFSFAPNPDWSLTHSPQPEILEYLKSVARKLKLYPKVLFKHEVIKAQWHDGLWHINTNQGNYTCNVLVGAPGPFGSPQIPKFKGLEKFKGKAFHTARWEHEFSLKGKRVAVIGTGATAIQVVPELQKKASRLYVFQRTPSHIIPRIDIHTSSIKKAAFRHVPFLQKAVRASWYTTYELFIGTPQFVDQRFLSVFEAVASANLRHQVKDPELRKKLTPNYRFMCKRPVFNSTFYPALQQPNVSLETDGIREITETGIVDNNGKLHEVDAIVFATGFKVPNDLYERIYSNENVSVSESWGGRPKSYLGTSVSGFPNLFTMLGPFSAAGNQSAIFMLESQAAYITEAIKAMKRIDTPVIEVKADVEDEFYHDVLDRSKNTTWVSGGCTSYFQTAEGDNVGLWPNWSFLYRWKTRNFDISKFRLNFSSSNRGSK